MTRKGGVSCIRYAPLVPSGSAARMCRRKRSPECRRNSEIPNFLGRLAGWQLDRGILRNWPGDAAGSDAVCTATTSKTLPAIPRSLTFQGSTSPPSSNFGPLPVFHYRLHFAISLVDDRRNTQPRLFEIALVETLRSSSGGFVTEI